jgi:hypothetical protein
MNKGDIAFGKFLIIIAIIITVLVTCTSYIENNKTKDMINNGLEQCPEDPGSYTNRHTIWVKSCSEYIDKLRGK